MRSKSVLLLILIVVSTLVVGKRVIGLMVERATLPSTGTMKAIGVGIYWDDTCTNQTTSIEWGLLEPGSTKNMTVFVRNEGNTPSTLSLQTENWIPENASSYITLTWDYTDETLEVEDVVAITLILSVSDTIEHIPSFSFDIIISIIG